MEKVETNSYCISLL